MMGGEMTDLPRPAYAAPRKLSRWLLLLLLLNLLAAAIAVVTGFLARLPLVQLRKGVASDAVINAVLETEERHNLVSAVHGAIGIIVGILFLMWVYRVARNAHALAVKPMRFTPGSAVWWYFVPVFNIFRPYQAFFEVWSVSADPDAPYRNRRSDALALWWFLWLVSNALLTVAIIIIVVSRKDDIGSLLLGNIFRLGGDILAIPLSLAVMRIVVRLNKLQAAYHHRHHEAHKPDPRVPANANPAHA
ncbi:DUF4328 domain-containing protein [Devosia sp. D6-9]|nr:DUF4328 domain-containing protein [Devosia sp. D6-9]